MEQASPKRRKRWVVVAVAALLGVVVEHSRERATFIFALETLRGSRRHKLLAALGIAVALVLALETAGSSVVSHFRSGEAWQPWQLQAILAIPLVIGTVVISTLCYVSQLPSELDANWIFRMAEKSGRPEMLNGFERLLILCGLFPVLACTVPIEILAVGWPTALAHTSLVALLLLLWTEFRLNGWHKIPFTCSYVPGRRNFWQVLGAYLFLLGAVIPTVVYFEVRFLHPFLLLGCTVGLGFVYRNLRSARQLQWKLVPLVFDESDEPLIRPVQLNRD